MPKPRTCPHCHEVLPICAGFRFDEQMNLLCAKCGEVVFKAVRSKSIKEAYCESNIDSDVPLSQPPVV